MTRTIIKEKAIFGLKDETGAYVKEDKPEIQKDPPTSDISSDDLLSKQLLIIYRQTRALLEESTLGLLSKDSQTALVQLVNMTFEFKKKERELLDNMSDEQIKALMLEHSKS